MSADEFKLLTDADPLANWQTMFGFDDPAKTAAQNQQDALAALPSAKTFSLRLAVSYQDLVNLVKTRFVNPRLDGIILLGKLELDIDDVFRFKKHSKYKPLDRDLHSHVAWVSGSGEQADWRSIARSEASPMHWLV